MKPHDDIIHVAGARTAGWLFALPWLIGLFGLSLVPMALSLAVSFTSWDGLSLRGGAQWIGTQHYAEILDRDPHLRRALANTLYYTLGAVPLGLVASLAAALLLNTPARGVALFRAVFMVPYILGGVATVMIWSWLFNPQFGIVNAILRSLYKLIHPLVGLFRTAGTTDWITPDWFYSPHTCKPALIIMYIWLGGGTMLIFLAALQRVPPEQLEAITLDGAGPWLRFRHVTLAHISPAVFFNLVVGLVFTMQTFDPAYLLYNRAQQNGLLLYMLHLYRAAFEPPYRVGYASALAWVLFAAIALLVLPVIALARRFVYHQVQR